MTLEEFKVKITELHEMGWVKSLRKGDTGVGHTLEQMTDLAENNIAGPDLGEIELKSKRESSQNRVTLFTLDSGAWKIHPKQVINDYGYIDKKKRNALKCTVTIKPNPQHLFLDFPKTKEHVILKHTDGTVLAEWKRKSISTAFEVKMPNLIVVDAKSRFNDEGEEEFLYNRAFYLENCDSEAFMNLLADGDIVIEPRMHLNSNGGVRNRGTAFRLNESKIENCFESKINLIES